VLLLGASVVVDALRRVQLPPRQLARPQRGVRHRVVALLPRVAGEHLVSRVIRVRVRVRVGVGVRVGVRVRVRVRGRGRVKARGSRR
jgi:hypothetical protein